MRLIVRTEQGDEEVHEFEGTVVSIGRSVGNHLPINDLNSSRHHCEVHRTADGYELIDRDSRNGTFLNGRRVSRCALRPGDTFEIGTTLISLNPEPTARAATAVGRETLDITTGLHKAVERNRERERQGEAAGRSSAPGAERLEELESLLALNKVLASELDLQRLLGILMETCLRITGAERGFLLLNEGGKARVAISRNIDQEEVRDAAEKISRSITREVLQSGKPVLLDDAGRDERAKENGRTSIMKLQLRSVLSVPLRHRDDIIGAMTLDNRFEAGRFTRHSLGLVETIADQATIAIINARLFEENKRRSDELARAKEELERLNAVLRDRLEQTGADLAEARAALARSTSRDELDHDFPAIVTRSPRMVEVLAVIDRIADSQVPVLIQGESGTGKELVARAVHETSPRADGPLITINCAAIPQHLMESEFFGHVRGAFTGATADKAGLFEAADGGTLFLDEVGDMDLEIQTKLLRVLQDGVVRRIGAKATRQVDVRIVAATNRDLTERIASGHFREDLYYRLNVINLVLPPLRDRREDIPLLVEAFAAEMAPGRVGEAIFSEAALDALVRHDWKGNVRELRNEVERALALARGEVGAEDLSSRVREAPGRAVRSSRRLALVASEGVDLKELVQRETEVIEREVIAEMLRRHDYKKKRTAERLGISRPTLDAKIDKYGLDRESVLGDSTAG